MEKYEIFGKIGKGNYGLVHLVRRIADNKVSERQPSDFKVIRSQTCQPGA